MDDRLNLTGFVGLGSNLGNAQDNLLKAVAALGANGLRVETLSDIFYTEPQGRRDQPWFLNMVARISVPLEFDPESILEVLLEIERGMGRIRSQVWGPRTIDLDLLLLGDTMHNSSRLTLPHPRLHERAFVLVPLCQLAPNLVIKGARVDYWLSTLNFTLDKAQIRQP